MSGHVPDPSPPRREGGGTSVLAWALPLSLTALVIVLAWQLYQSMPKATHDPGAQPRTVSARGDLADDEKATIELFRAASPAVVQVTAFRRGTDGFGSREFQVPLGSGSGFVWDAQGYVVTNFHVVAVGDSYSVTFPNHDVFEAQLAGRDEVHDLAVLKADTKGKALPTLPVGKSGELVVGQKVFAIGNPFGLDQTLTTGIISGLNREITSLVETPIRGVIQTDAAINPGNSGGPLLDSAGRVIGLNTQIASPSGASSGVGFAIPVDMMNKIVPQIIRTGSAVRPGLGIGKMIGGLLNRSGLRGVIFLEYAPTSAARSAGILATKPAPAGQPQRLGDVIVGIGGERVETTADLFRILDAREIGDEVEVRYLRDGEELRARVKLVGVE
jgi:S1-C subfamily serine protease